MAACAKKLKDKIEQNHKTVKKGLQRQMIMDVGEGKRFKNICVVQNIELQKQLKECDEIKKNEKKCSPMSKTRSRQGSDEWGNFSNLSKTIVNQSIGGSLLYCSNDPMGVSLPMSKTRSKLGSEGKCRDCSNVSKTIEIQCIKGSF